MGADLYMLGAYNKRLQSIQPELEEVLTKLDYYIKYSDEYEKAEKDYITLLDKLHHGVYFRDSYNCKSIAWSLDLSWWIVIYPMLDKDFKLSKHQTHELIKLIKTKDVRIEENSLEYFKSTKEARGYFYDKKAQLLSFLNRAIDNDDEIFCSL